MALMFVLAGTPSPEPVRAAVTFPCLGAPAGEPAGGVYPEPRIFLESQSWWTENGEVFPGRHIHTGACIPWLKPVDGVVQFHVRNLLHSMPGTVKQFRLQIWNNGPDPALALPLFRSCATNDCTFWDSFTIDYAGRLPGRWEHRFTHNIEPNVFGQRQFTTTRWHICVRTCVGGTTEAYTRAVGAAGWYQGMDYANAYLDPDDYERLRAGLAPGQHRVKIKFDPGSGSMTVDPDAHGGNPGTVQRRASDGMLLGGFLPVTTGTAWFEAIVDTTGLAPGVHKLALRGAKANATGRQEGVLVVPFIVTGTAPPPPAAAAFTAAPLSGQAPLTVDLADTSTGGPTEWHWGFGDGSPNVTVQDPGSHTYTASGTYTLSLTVDNANGPPSTATRTITVEPPPAAGAAFTAAPLSGQAPLTVALTDTSTGTPTEWAWAFGDGSPDVTVQNPGSHTYTAVGTYICSLTVDNANGPPSTATRTITVDPPPPPPPPTGRIKDITFDPTLLDPVHGVDKLSGTVTRETAAPLAGPGSARISNASAYVEETFSATDDVFITFRMKATALPSGSPRVFMLSNGGTTQANLLLKSTGRLQLRVGSTIVGAESIALNTSTTYIVGIRQRRGTGGNALVEAYVAPVGTAFGAPFAARSNGTWTTAADRVRIGGTNGSAVSVILDNVLIDRSSMPITPLP